MMRRNTVRTAAFGLCCLLTISACGGCSLGKALSAVAPTVLTSVLTSVLTGGAAQ